MTINYKNKSMTIQNSGETNTIVDISIIKPEICTIDIPNLKRHYINFSNVKNYFSNIGKNQIIFGKLEKDKNDGDSLMMTYIGESDDINNRDGMFVNILTHYDDEHDDEYSPDKIIEKKAKIEKFVDSWKPENGKEDKDMLFMFVDFFIDNIQSYRTLQLIKRIQLMNDESLYHIFKPEGKENLDEIIAKYKKSIPRKGVDEKPTKYKEKENGDKSKRWKNFKSQTPDEQKAEPFNTNNLYFNTNDLFPDLESETITNSDKAQKTIYKCYDLQILYLIKHLEVIELFKLFFYFTDMLFKKVSILLFVLALYKKKAYDSDKYTVRRIKNILTGANEMITQQQKVLGDLVSPDILVGGSVLSPRIGNVSESGNERANKSVPIGNERARSGSESVRESGNESANKSVPIGNELVRSGSESGSENGNRTNSTVSLNNVDVRVDPNLIDRANPSVVNNTVSQSNISRLTVESPTTTTPATSNNSNTLNTPFNIKKYFLVGDPKTIRNEKIKELREEAKEINDLSRQPGYAAEHKEDLEEKLAKVQLDAILFELSEAKSKISQNQEQMQLIGSLSKLNSNTADNITDKFVKTSKYYDKQNFYKQISNKISINPDKQKIDRSRKEIEKAKHIFQKGECLGGVCDLDDKLQQLENIDKTYKQYFNDADLVEVMNAALAINNLNNSGTKLNRIRYLRFNIEILNTMQHNYADDIDIGYFLKKSKNKYEIDENSTDKRNEYTEIFYKYLQLIIKLDSILKSKYLNEIVPVENNGDLIIAKNKAQKSIDDIDKSIKKLKNSQFNVTNNLLNNNLKTSIIAINDLTIPNNDKIAKYKQIMQISQLLKDNLNNFSDIEKESNKLDKDYDKKLNEFDPTKPQQVTELEEYIVNLKKKKRELIAKLNSILLKFQNI
jgi:hypothetical protein